MLHPSGDLVGSLRHAQLTAAGAPRVESDLVADVRAELGTAAHTIFERLFRGTPTMLEIQLDPWLPPMWSGRADFVTWDPDRRAFVLGDLKTCKPEAIPYIHRNGMKETHLWQASAYWHALADMGIPLVHGFVVYYLPTNAIHGQIVEPTVQEATPVPREQIHAEMNYRAARTKLYLDHVNAYKGRLAFEGNNDGTFVGAYLNEHLEPVQPREFATLYDKAVSKAKGVETPGFKVVLRPNWSAMYCPFPNELCDCRLQKSQKVGHWTHDLETDSPVWTFSRGAAEEFPQFNPANHFPDVQQLTKLRKETENASSS